MIDDFDPVDVALWRRMFGNADFDPATLTAASLAATAVGGGLTAAGTLAGGSYAKQAADLQATQLRMNAAQSIASGQRQMLDTQEKTRLAESTTVARAAASGVNAGVGSPATDVGNLAERGEYHALMDLFNGESAATGMENQAAAARWTGRAQQDASYLAAGGDIASAAGSMARGYGAYRWPAVFRGA